jgi:2-methylcitrate dehydratase PrpD
MLQPAAPARQLATFAANIRFQDLPPEVVSMARDLAIDWFGSCVAGGGARAVQALHRTCAALMPGPGPCTILPWGEKVGIYTAAMLNAAACHVVEQDDVHNGSVFHPAAVVFPAAFAAAEARDLSGPAVIEAVVAGYETGIRVGEFLGRSHYVHFHTTATAGAIAAAAATGRLLQLDARQMLHAFGSAGTQAAGLWEFLADAADSKQLHTARASANGLFAAFAAAEGLTGASEIFDGPHGMGVALSQDADPARLTDGLGHRWAILETSYKWHASCRHTHPAADALAEVMGREGLQAGDIARVTAHVHRAAIDVLGAVDVPETVHQSKFSMGTVLGLVAVHGRAGVAEFDRLALTCPDVAAFRDRVTMEHSPEVEAIYPQKWLGRVTVETHDGRRLSGATDDPKGDPGNPLTWEEILAKAGDLIRYHLPQEAEARLVWLDRLSRLPQAESIARLFSQDLFGRTE